MYIICIQGPILAFFFLLVVNVCSSANHKKKGQSRERTDPSNKKMKLNTMARFWTLQETSPTAKTI